jgi:MFS family permease
VLPSFLGPVIGIISDRYGRKWLATSGFLLAIPVEALFRLVTHNSLSQKILLVVLLALLGLSMSLIVTPITAELTLVAERLQRTGKLGNNGAYAQVGVVRFESL